LRERIRARLEEVVRESCEEAHNPWLGSAVFDCTGGADLTEGAFNELLTLLTEAVIDGGHCLDDASSRTGEGEFAVLDLALVEGESTVAEYHETAVGEIAGFIFVEIKDDFFVVELVVADFHGIELGVLVSGFGMG